MSFEGGLQQVRSNSAIPRTDNAQSQPWQLLRLAYRLTANGGDDVLADRRAQASEGIGYPR